LKRWKRVGERMRWGRRRGRCFHDVLRLRNEIHEGFGGHVLGKENNRKLNYYKG